MKKLLLVDAGNTRVKWAIGPAARTERLRLAGESDTLHFEEKQAETLARRYPDHLLILACVVPRLLPHFKKSFAERITVVRGDLPKLGLKFLYPRPAELGADRLACAVAAQALFPGPTVIVACGTANAFTVLDSRNRLCGGVIAPGWPTQQEALLGRAAQLPKQLSGKARVVPGKSTQAALQLGLKLSFRGATREILETLGREFTPSPHLLLTGGNAAHLERDFFLRLGLPVTVKPLLVLEGLRIIGERDP